MIVEHEIIYINSFMNYLTEYYKNKSIMLQERVNELENVLNFIKENPDYYLNEGRGTWLARLFGDEAAEQAAAASRKIPWSKASPNVWKNLTKEQLKGFVGPPLKWVGKNGIEHDWLIKDIGEGLYEVYRWSPDPAPGQWRNVVGETPWGKVNPTTRIISPPKGRNFSPSGGFVDTQGQARLALPPDSSTSPVFRGSGGDNYAGGSNEDEITI